ncbi:hypothetical protein ARMGADRAFT_1062813 [Armillaria gallica]|uniref:Uncharacterized protein n=1 Tax=Armillaria gallica TaxID=47427 RepID=A0A2H3DFR0_ARMGA|nr:hypothetical protein ARMGADRAFT_1062813 [Armillaria gallica]
MVVLRPYGVLSYVIQPVGEAILSLSTDPLHVGDYGWFLARTKSANAIEIAVSLPVIFSRRRRQCPGLYHRIRIENLDLGDLQVLPNANLLCKELIPYFQDNAFSVDINAPWQLLPTHMPRPKSRLEMFLRAHFHTPLRANLLGGDIREDYPWAATVKMMGQLGVRGEQRRRDAPSLGSTMADSTRASYMGGSHER